MELNTAIDFISPAISPTHGVWADLGAGTGIFTLALDHILEPGSTIYAADKNPHMLYKLQLAHCQLIIEELDFTRDFSLPPMDGIVMANALHYAKDQVAALSRVVDCLKPGGTLLLIEYETERPLPTWIPYPIPFKAFESLAARTGLTRPQEISRMPSAYGHEHIYLAAAEKG